MAKKASSSRRPPPAVARLDARKPPAASNLRVCERCFLRLRLPLARESRASNPPSRQTASERLGLGKCGSASSGLASPSRSGSSRSSTSDVDIRPRAADSVNMASSLGAGREEGRIGGGEIAVGVRPLMKRAMRNGPDVRLPVPAHNRSAARLEQPRRSRPAIVGDPFLDPDRRSAPAQKRRLWQARYSSEIVWPAGWTRKLRIAACWQPADGVAAFACWLRNDMAASTILQFFRRISGTVPHRVRASTP